MEAKAILSGRNEDLTLQEALNLLQNAVKNPELVSYVPPVKPKAGDIFVYSPGENLHKIGESVSIHNNLSGYNINISKLNCLSLIFLDDWKCDQYRWFQNGAKQLPKKSPVVRKLYFVSVTPDGNNNLFRRNSYRLLEDSHTSMHLTLIQYLGDEKTATDYPHGNSKSTNQPKLFIRTCPSVLKSLSGKNDLPSAMYKKAIATNDCGGDHQPVLNPRNSKQIANMQFKERQKFRLTHDALYNLHEVAYDLNGFVAKITTYPDLVLICGLQTMAQELENLIQSSLSSPQLLSYDTTFQVGDFYLSPLLFRHTAFTSSPIMPIAFLIHERKFQSAHEELMKHVSVVVPSLSKSKTPIPVVTDDELGMCNAIDKYLPCLTRLKCWNHTINSIKVLLQSCCVSR